METDLGRRRAWWFRWRIQDLHDPLQNIHDGGFVDVQTDFEFLLKQRQFSGKLSAIAESRTHFNESPNNEDAHLNSAGAVQHVRGHYCSMFSEGARRHR